MAALRRIVRGLRLASRGGRLPPAQQFVLQQLAVLGGATINELAARTLTDQSSVSAVVSKLEAKRLVSCRRAPPDRRRKRVQLTARGTAAAKSAPGVAARLAAGLAAMTPRERERLADALERWVKLAALNDVSPRLFFEDE